MLSLSTLHTKTRLCMKIHISISIVSQLENHERVWLCMCGVKRVRGVTVTSGNRQNIKNESALGDSKHLTTSLSPCAKGNRRHAAEQLHQNKISDTSVQK